MTLYTWGYSRSRAPADLIYALEAVGVVRKASGTEPAQGLRTLVIVDCRRALGSRNHWWHQRPNGPLMGAAFFLGVLGVRCEWPQGDLGNTSGSATWVPPDTERAQARIRETAAAIAEGQVLVLVCAEADHRKCHRTAVAEAVREVLGGELEIMHLASTAPTSAG